MDILFIPLSLLCSTHFITLFLLFCRLYTPTLHFHGSERNFCPFYWISLSRKRFHSLSSPALRTRKMELSSCGWPKICRTRPDRSSISLDSSFVLFLSKIKKRVFGFFWGLTVLILHSYFSYTCVHQHNHLSPAQDFYVILCLSHRSYILFYFKYMHVYLHVTMRVCV